jgi:hypothetical protein
MKLAKIVLAAAVVIFPVGAGAQQRAGNAVIGALAGAVVFGPVGAVAGAAVGYTAGEGIGRAWGLKRTRRARNTANSSWTRTNWGALQERRITSDRLPTRSAITAHQIRPAADIPLNPARREALFREFLEWQKRQSVETVFQDFLRPQEQDTQAR